MESFDIVLGLAMIYSWVHFIVLSFTETWKERNTYEKTMSLLAIAFFALFLIGAMS